MRSPIPVRWIAITIFVLSAVLNYLDRQVLATMATIWKTRPEFPFSDSDYGTLLAVFSLAYAISAPFVGWFIDKVGLNRGIAISVIIWAAASFGTGMVHNLDELMICRAVLGIAEASGVSAVGKAIGMYLLPEERALGQAMGQLGLSLGAGLAPRFAVFFAYTYDWRWAFFAAGLLSLAWIPVWLFTSRVIPPVAPERSSMRIQRTSELIADPKLWALVLANFLGMTVYSLWTNWSPTYLVSVHHLTAKQAANYSQFVPIAGYIGAVLGGSVSWRLIRKGMQPVDARKRVCLMASVGLLITMAIPLMPTPALATVGMSLSFFLIGAWSTNIYSIPIDLYGAARAAFGISALLFAYGAMQAVVSRPLGAMIEHYGFQPVCLLFGVLPLLASFVLVGVIRTAKPLPEPVVVHSR